MTDHTRVRNRERTSDADSTDTDTDTDIDHRPVAVPPHVDDALYTLFVETGLAPELRNTVAEAIENRGHDDVATWIRENPRRYDAAVKRGFTSTDTTATATSEDRPTLSGPVAPPTVEWDGSTASVWVEAPEEDRRADKPTDIARSIPAVNGLQYGRDNCPDCGDPWGAYGAHTSEEAIVHVLLCDCGCEERETQYFARDGGDAR